MSIRFDSAWGLTRSLAIYYGQPWRRMALRHFYSTLIRPGDLVFDIGAHVGSRTRTLLSLGANVVAVEPQPLFADLIERHFKGRLTGFERVAVGKSTGEITLRISSRHPTVTSISSHFIDGVRQTGSFRNVVWDSKVTVPMTTLDALITRYGRPKFCKIDVEGAESDILEGLRQPLDLIAFEYIPAMPDIAAAAIRRLCELGPYRFNRVVGEKHAFANTGWSDAGTLLRTLSALSPESPSGDIYARLEH